MLYSATLRLMCSMVASHIERGLCAVCESTSRDVVINDVNVASLKTPEWSQLVFCDDFVN
jgi:hypothetical protein